MATLLSKSKIKFNNSRSVINSSLSPVLYIHRISLPRSWHPSLRFFCSLHQACNLPGLPLCQIALDHLTSSHFLLQLNTKSANSQSAPSSLAMGLHPKSASSWPESQIAHLGLVKLLSCPELAGLLPDTDLPLKTFLGGLYFILV